MSSKTENKENKETKELKTKGRKAAPPPPLPKSYFAKKTASFTDTDGRSYYEFDKKPPVYLERNLAKFSESSPKENLGVYRIVLGKDPNQVFPKTGSSCSAILKDKDSPESKTGESSNTSVKTSVVNFKETSFGLNSPLSKVGWAIASISDDLKALTQKPEKK